MSELDYKESRALKNCSFWTVLLEKILESPLDCKEIQLVHPKGNQFWIFIGRTDAEAETPILWPCDAKRWLIWKKKKIWCWERLKAGGEEDDRGWDSWMASPTQWTWVNSESWWRTRRPGVPQSMWSQRVGHDGETELNWKLSNHRKQMAILAGFITGFWEVKVKSFSHVRLCDRMVRSLPGSTIHGISRQEYWSGLPFPSPWDLPDPGIKPASPTLQANSLPSELSRNPWILRGKLHLEKRGHHELT